MLAFIWIIVLAGSKVNDFDFIIGCCILFKQDILRLEVPVHYLVLVAVIDAGQNMFHDPACFWLWKSAFFNQLIEQLAPCANFGDNVESLVIFEVLVDFDDVGVI